jgi:anti-anti-sigma factor
MRTPTVKLPTDSFLWPNVEKIYEKVLSLARKNGWKTIDLDLRDVELLTAAGLGKLMRLKKELKLTLRNVRPHVHEVLELTHLSRVLDVR